ncbi:glycosyltransferase family A protein [Paenibacillus sp. BR2-3]|uniref:glycosyltransferase n=1 Tax=Paenibacillus sp. BR2-3 TaxID=3048494 RepID=UPI003977A954
MKSNTDSAPYAVSILTCTKRPDCLNTLFENYRRQNYKNKELIVILNNNNLKMNDYIHAAKKDKDVRIFRLPENLSLGHCLNFGVRLSKYSYIAKFDDDDYYSTNYLTDSMQCLRTTNADIVGKRAHYMYLNDKKLLLLRYNRMENKYVSLVQGATLLVKSHVFRQISFPDQNRGECIKFCSDCLAHGFNIYSGNKYNFAAVRRKNSKDHTWIVSDKNLLTKNVKVLRVNNFKKYVSRN